MSFIETLIDRCLITWLSVISAHAHPSKTHASDSDCKTESTVYEMLENFNLPKGILPECAKGYLLYEDNRFEVYLVRDYKINVQGVYTLYYKREITGRVGYDSLRDLKGMSMKILFIWLSINEVSSGDENLDFYVGPISASFSLQFSGCPQYVSGVDCP